MNEVIQFLLVVVLSVFALVVLPMTLVSFMALLFTKKEPAEPETASGHSAQ